MANLDGIWIILCALLVFLQQIGFLCLESGLVRTKNRINVAVKNLADLTLVIVFFALIGHGILTGHWFQFSNLPSDTTPYNNIPSLLLYALYCATTITIVAGAVAERMLIRPYLILGMVVAILVFPVSAGWVWISEGWLAQLGAIDFAGGTVVHASAGALALACVIQIGPRKHRFNGEQSSNGSDLGLSITGGLFLWVGWIGFNAGSFLSWHENTTQVIWTTFCAGAMGGTFYLLRILFTQQALKVDVLINSILASLVAVTAATHLLTPLETLGFSFAGVVAYSAISRLMIKLKLDDAIDAIAVHLGAGTVGTLLIPLVESSASFVGQLAMLTSIALFSFFSAFITLKVIARLGVRLRVTNHEEDMGLNLVEHEARSDLYELINLMSYHRETGDLNKSMYADPYTEEGLIAQQYSLTAQSMSATQKKLENAKLKAEKASQAKSEFLANMSHEIRTPMNGVLGITQILSKTTLNQEQGQLVNTICSSGKMLMSIINDILDFSKVESQKLTLNPVPTDLNKLMHDTLLNHKANAQEKGLELILDMDKLIQNYCVVDDVRLSQIVGNLLGNAIKFTESGYVSIACTSQSVNATTSEVLVGIQDTGVGIEAGALEKVFSAFEQEDTSTTRQFGGTGLGLSLSKSLVELMGGELKVESEKGQGSTFSFKIVCPNAQLTEVTEVQDVAPLLTLTTPKTLLIVDDIQLNHDVIVGMLKDAPIQITSCLTPFDGLACLEKAKSEGKHFDFMILDFMMPKMNGLMFFEQAEAELSKHCRTMMLSSSNDMSLFDQAKQMGIHTAHSKPVLESYIVDFINAAQATESELVSEPSKDQAAQLKDRIKHASILVVEDNDINFMVIESQLLDLEAKISHAKDGQQAVDQYQAHGFDLVLMDCMLPVMDGLTATQHIREIESKTSTERVPIIALTANVTKENQEKCLSVGMDDFLSKPFSEEKLIQVLAKWI